jgi:hypothetical protein
MNDKTSLRARGARRLALSLAIIAWFLFVPARSLRFWQAWLFLALTAAFWISSQIYFLRHDPRLLERRLQNKEAQPQQRLFQIMWSVILPVSFVLAGLDFRLGWSRHWLGPIPLAGVLAGDAMVLAGYSLVFWVMKTNTFAASTIQGGGRASSYRHRAVRRGAASDVQRNGVDRAGHAICDGIVYRRASVRVDRAGADLPADS